MVGLESPAPSEQSRASFSVVGVGASAGGLEALSELLRHLPASTGMAYVLVQHLDPAHGSQLTHLLGRVARMPVLETTDGMAVAPDHVYVIPPDTVLSIEQGVLRHWPRGQARGQHLPVDRFFRSLAEDRGRQAVGVILSGTGSDGAAGVAAIKARGGTTFAQDGTATHDGMPHSAVNSGCVDFTLPPERIADELVRISQHPYVNGGQGDVAAPEHDTGAVLATLLHLLHGRTHVDYANYKRSTVMRRIQRRLVLHRLDRLEDYVAFVREHPDELQDLHQDLLIHVTRFFRDPEVFEALASQVFPALVHDRPPEVPIRMWVPGCSSGEEVYSLGISLLEALGDRADSTPIKLFATDLSEPTLAGARAGKYPRNIAADVSEERLRRFFLEEDGGYRIRKSLRDLCVFARHDMTRDPPFSGLDLVSCRNVLIYLEPALQRRALPLFHYALGDRGTLVLGSSESLGALEDHFTVVDAKHKIYAKKAVANRLLFTAWTGNVPPGEQAIRLERTQQVVRVPDTQREADRLVLARYGPPGVVIDENGDILQFRGQTGSYLAPAPGTASLNVLKMARQGLLIELRAALAEARLTGKAVRREGLRIEANSHTLDASVEVVPFEVGAQRCFVVLFDEAKDEAERGPVQLAARQTGDPVPSSDDPHQLHLAQLQEELSGTKEYLDSVIERLEASNEELRAANEEVLSSNEELQSTNEELQTSKEELQATNEELGTVNEELERRNREAIQLSDDLRNLLRGVEIPIVMVGQDLRIRRFSPSAGGVFSLIASDVDRPITDVKFKLVGVDLERAIAAVLDSLVVADYDVQDPDGRWRRVCIRPYRTEQNQIDGVVISVVDIDESKRNEQHLRSAREYAESIIATVQMPLVVLDTDLCVVSANRAFYDTFRTTAAETERRPLDELGNRTWHEPALLELLRDTLERDKAFTGFVVERDFPALGRRRLLLNGRRLLRHATEPAFGLLAIDDVTDRHRLETELRQAQRMEAVGHLAAGVAHDFNNLMTVVQGSASLLLEEPLPNASMRELINDIASAGERAATLTHQLLAFSRSQMIAPKVLDINALVAETERMLHRLIGENVHLTTLLDPGAGHVFADPAVIEQAMVNLAINARDAMPDGGELTITTRKLDLDEENAGEHTELASGPYVQLMVKDTGIGMDDATLARSFEPFFTTKDVGAGSGLGLSSVYGSVKQSGGTIFADSQPGQGATFTIYLPRLPASSVADTTRSATKAIPRGTETVLLVEDASEVRRLAQRMLRAAGYTVLEAENGKAALKLSERHPSPIHLLVSDVVMPEMGGPALADALVTTRPEMKVLFLSGYAPESLLRGAVTERAFLQKPYTSAALASKVREVLDSTEQGQQPEP
jgi:two-component system, chemotaxis family, CheB/CheR fusion protein